MKARPASSWLERADRAGRFVETALLAALLAAMIGLATWQILLRNIMGAGLGWADEALRIMVLWVTLIGAVAASRERRHVNIDVLSRYLPAAWRGRGGAATDAFAAVTCAVLAWASYQFVAGSAEEADTVFAGQVPAWAVQVILPAGFTLLAYRYAIASLAGPRRDAGGPTGH